MEKKYINLKKESWCVYNDGSVRFKNIVIAYINANKPRYKWEGIDNNSYYGFDIDKLDSNKYCIKYKPIGVLLTIEDFEETLANQLFEPKRGELVEVKTVNGDWTKRIYVGTLEGARHPYYTVCGGNVIDTIDEKNFKDGKSYSVTSWDFMRKIEKPKIVIDIKFTVNGMEKNPADFTDAEWLAFKNKK